MMLLPLLFALHPQPAMAVEYAAAIEINTFVDDEGRLVFRQLIVWEECSAVVMVDGKARRCPDARNIVAWRLLNGSYTLDRSPYGWRLTFVDGKDGNRLKRIEAPRIEQTISNYDPEVAQRSLGLPRREMMTLPRKDRK